MSNCLEIIKAKMLELDKSTKDCLTTEDYASKCRFAHNVLKDIVKEIETNKGETK